jgi:hypothetical protein
MPPVIRPTVRLLPDEERAQSLWLLGLDRNVSHDGQIGPARVHSTRR